MTHLLSRSTPPSKSPANPNLVIDLAAIDSKMIPIAGGKAANLGELLRASLPVPPGFCVTTEAYGRVANSASIDFDGFQGAGLDELNRLAAKARRALLMADFPDSIAESIVASYNQLGFNVPVAVRSSATAEDLPNASFAGQQDTYLNIVGVAAVLDAVQRCWASLWTDRAVVYRTTNGIDHRTVRLAVVVQRMIDSQVAGVLFTANPVTGKRRQAVIDASPGLGEAVVSGSVNPDHFVVDTDRGEIVERRLGDKRFSIRSLPGGGTRHAEMPSGAGHSCLTDDQVRSLAVLGNWVEAHFGAPQDIEWAIDPQGVLWLTQARPITTLFPVPAGMHKDTRIYFCFSVAQGLYRPITPMGLASFRLLASVGAGLLGLQVEDRLKGPAAFAEIGQRVFIDLTKTLRGSAGRTLIPKMFDVMEARSAATLRQLFEEPGFSQVRNSWFAFARGVVRNLIAFGIPPKVLRALYNPQAARAQVEKTGLELEKRLTPPQNVCTCQRLDFVEKLLATEVMALGPQLFPLGGAGLAMMGLAGKLLGDDAKPGELEKVLRGLPHNITTEMDLQLWKLATEIRSDAQAAVLLRDTPAVELSRLYQQRALPSIAQRGLEAFLSQYGHRAVAEIDLGMPRWADDPAHILGVLANYLRLDNPEFAPDAVFARGAAEGEAMANTLAERAGRKGWLRGKVVRFALDRTRQLAGLREIPKYFMIKVLAAARAELAKIGAVLAERGVIETAEDVFVLDFADVRSAIQGSPMQARVAGRREQYEIELRRRQVPTVLLSDGTVPEVRRAVVPGNGLAGTPASAGSITGVARVILDPVGAHIEPGEILVAPSTDPGWTPLFLTAAGLVMEMGGANSHGAVVAREYGIPAVVGVSGATQRIVSGQRITVDGGTGIVSLQP